MTVNDDKWTFACELVRGWTAPLYNTREEAINGAKELFPTAKFIQIGQIKSFYGTEYVENQEYI